MNNKLKLIGTSEIFDCPDEEFYLVYCPLCDSLFNIPKSKLKVGKIKCHNCHEELEI